MSSLVTTNLDRFHLDKMCTLISDGLGVRELQSKVPVDGDEHAPGSNPSGHLLGALQTKILRDHTEHKPLPIFMWRSG